MILVRFILSAEIKVKQAKSRKWLRVRRFAGKQQFTIGTG